MTLNCLARGWDVWAMVRVQQVTATFGPLAANNSDGLWRADGILSSGVNTHTCTHSTHTTLHTHNTCRWQKFLWRQHSRMHSQHCAYNMHTRRGYDIKLHPHRMLALMASMSMGRKATTKQTVDLTTVISHSISRGRQPQPRTVKCIKMHKNLVIFRGTASIM